MSLDFLKIVAVQYTNEEMLVEFNDGFKARASPAVFYYALKAASWLETRGDVSGYWAEVLTPDEGLRFGSSAPPDDSTLRGAGDNADDPEWSSPQALGHWRNTPHGYQKPDSAPWLCRACGLPAGESIHRGDDDK